jgi:uncharacterized protein YerC
MNKLSRGKVDPKTLVPQKRMEYLDILWTSIAGLGGRDAVKNFFKDLLSESESIMLGRRIIIAKELLQGSSYAEIKMEHNVGTNTINRVQDWLTSGFGGYDKALEMFEKELNSRARRRKKIVEIREVGPFGSLKHKYPMQHLLFHLFDEVEAQVKLKKKTKYISKVRKKQAKLVKKSRGKK